MAQQELWAYGLYKFGHFVILSENPRILQVLVDYWDPNYETFQLDGMSLSLKFEDIYFITGLS